MIRHWIAVATVCIATFLISTWTGYRAHAADREALRALEELVADLAASQVVESHEPVAAPTNPGIDRALGELGERIAALESRRVEVAFASGESDRVAPDESPDTEALALEAQAEFEQVIDELSANGWDLMENRDAYQRFLELNREHEFLEQMIEELEGLVEMSPGSVDARMELAQVYLGKLMTVSGPEQGLWGGKAEQQWLSVVELDDAHWGAHSSLGTTYSYYPEVLGKTPDAIRYLERARDLQRDMAPAQDHIETYLFLARMHQRQGNHDAARAALVEGIDRHPDQEELTDALSQLP